VIVDLHGYCEQKESGHAWLGMVPTHWRVLANRGVFSEVKERGFRDAEMLSVTIGRGILPQSALLSESSKKDSSNLDRSKYKLVRPRDLAYNKMRAWQGAIGVSVYTGIISPAYVVMRPHNDAVVPRYFHYLYRTPSFAKEAERWSYGITSDMWSLRPEHFKTIYTLVPPPDEQALIVRFLDWASVRLGKAIAAKRKVIGLLEEQKQAIIHRAVTRGLDDVPLKPSGLDWLGDVPEHWEVVAIGRHINLQTGFAFKSSDFKSEGTRLLRGVNVATGRIRWESNVFWPTNRDAEVRLFDLGLGDLVLGMDRPVISSGVRIARVTEADLPSLLVQRVARIRCREHLSNAYAILLLSGKPFKEYLKPIFTGISVPHLSPKQILSFPIPLPPLEEQDTIVARLDSETLAVDRFIATTKHEIQLLQEYRTRLIADVVTGKLDVREFARTLPADIAEEAAELASSDLGDEFADTDDELADELTGEPA
jgi:type I restriction enzyme, S subunit